MKVSKVQIVIIAVAVIAALVAMGVLSGRLPGIRAPGSRNKTNLVIWGTIPKRALSQELSTLKRELPAISLTYQEKSKASFESELVNALATAEGPDIIIFPSGFVLKQKDKFFLIPETFLTERNFRDTFVDGSELLIFEDGILGLPLTVDPLILYWNRDLFRNEGISAPPKTWDEFLVSSQALTKIDAAGNIIQSGAALGLSANIENLREIISLLVLQAGNPIVERESQKVVLTKKISGSLQPAENSVRFFTEFSNPQKASYSWSPAQPNSREAFARGDLAMYFGFGSEIQDIIDTNPHLNFDISSVPQIRGGKVTLTFGKFTSIGITRQSKSPEAAFQVLKFFTERKQLRALAQSLKTASARRDLLSERADDPTLEVIWREAVRFQSWLDIDPEKTSEIFSEMIQSVYSGRKSTGDATRDAEAQLEAMYKSR